MIPNGTSAVLVVSVYLFKVDTNLQETEVRTKNNTLKRLFNVESRVFIVFTLLYKWYFSINVSNKIIFVCPPTYLQVDPW